MKAPVILAAAAVIAATIGAGPATDASQTSVAVTEAVTAQDFDHATHLGFVSECSSCHAGVGGEGSIFPDPSFCANCHNGEMQPEVGWKPPAPADRNLKITHASHPPFDCAQCHTAAGAPEVMVSPVVANCFACHGIQADHHDASIVNCGMCHTDPPAPATHGYEWRQEHAVEAASSPERCATCHIRSECMSCHLPAAASPAPGFHPADFLQRHPSSAYNRETSCADCHNAAQFCQSCHVQAGLTAVGGIGAGYHDAQPNFAGGHGQAARQNLETCVSCHVERDCLRCHVTMNPHGPDFDAKTMRAKNAQMCTACHGMNVPIPPE